MAISIGASTTAFSNSLTSSLVINVPTHAVGDLLLVSVYAPLTGLFNVPTGWTATFNNFFSPGAAIQAYRIADGTEGSTLTVSWSGSTTVHSSGGITVFSGVDPVYPVELINSSSGTASTQNYYFSTANLQHPQSLVVGYFGSHSSSTQNTITAPTGFTEQWQTGSTTSAYTRAELCTYTQANPYNGYVNPAATMGTGNLRNMGIGVALHPAPPTFGLDKIVPTSSGSAASLKVTAGQLIVLYCAYSSASSTTSVTTTAGLTWTQLGSKFTGNSSGVDIYYAFATTTGTIAPVATVTNPGTQQQEYVWAVYSGTASGSGAFGAIATATSLSGIRTINLTSTVAGSLPTAIFGSTNGTSASAFGVGVTGIFTTVASQALANYAFFMANTPVPVVGTVKNLSGATNSSFSAKAVEILPASAYGIVGNTTNGTFLQTQSADRKYANQMTPSSSGILDYGVALLSLSATGGSSNAHLIVYSDSSGAPNALLAVSDELQRITSITEDAYYFSFSGSNRLSLVSGTPIWIGIHFSDPGTMNFQISRGNTGVNTVESAPDTYSDGSSNPFSSTTQSNGPLDIYMAYLIASGGTTGEIKAHNGTAFVAKPVKVWNGTAWVIKPLKVYNGTAWVPTNY